MKSIMINTLIRALQSVRDVGFCETIKKSTFYFSKLKLSKDSTNTYWNQSMVPGFTEQDLLAIDRKISTSEVDSFPEDEIYAEWLWIIPPFGEYSGGHADIFMLCSSLKQRFGARVILAISEPVSKPRMQEMRELLLKNYQVTDIQLVQFIDVSHLAFTNVVATGWQTVALSLRVKAMIRNYFVQDYEPFFFPSGAIQETIKSLYLKDFRYFTIGPWLSQKLAQDHEIESRPLPFSFDPAHYYLSPKNDHIRNKIVVYARISSPRRAVEIVLEALKLSSQDLNPNDEIVFIGERINLELRVKNKSFKFLNKSDLGALYRNAKLVIVFSTTNTSLIPLEALASGAPVLTNENEINRINLKGLPIIYTPLNPHSVARKIIQVSNSPYVAFDEDLSGLLEQLTWSQTIVEFLNWLQNE
jgi:glycosyltransferase involved in cell wall biosynthesis